ncbi:MAG: pilus assembly protein TadG-related protein [Pseudomonadota bacterium]
MVPQSPRRPADILSQEDGSISAYALVALAVFCMFLGLAIDVTNVHRQKEFISVAADAAAHAGVVALAEKKLPLDIRTAALAAAETNAPAGLIGKTNLGASDVELVRFDPKTRTIIAGEANAVKVTLHRDSSVGNPVSTSLLRFAGVKKFEFSVTSVAYYGKPGNCNSSDGIYAKGRVTLTSGNTIGGSYCVHSQEEVWMPQTNYFQEGAGLSMPNLADCGTKCFDAANPGVEDAKFEMNLNMMPVADHIALVRAAMLASTSDLKSQFFADKTLAADRKPLVDARIMNNGAAAKLVKGSVVSLTAAQYNDLMVLTKGNLPTGLVYNVDCRDRGNGPATWISIGGSLDRKDPTLTTSTAETVRQVVLITDCGFDVGSNARIDATLAISTRVSTSSVLKAASGAIVGDPLRNCDVSRKVYIMTMSGISVSSDFTASNVALIVNGDIHVAASSSSSTVEHKGTSFHAEGEVQIPANHTFNGCLEDYSGLIPGNKTIKFVIPKA